MGATDEPITEIRLTSNTNLLLNDSGPLQLRDYFGTGGDGLGLTLWAMNEARTFEGAPVDVLSVGGGFVNLTVPAAMGALVAGIAVGERWIFAGTSAGASASHEIQADESHPAITGGATVNKLTPARRLVTASEIYAAAGYTTGVELRSAVREEVQASVTYGNAAVYAQPTVLGRTPATSEVQASHTYGAPSATVAVNKYLSSRHVVEASGTLGLLTSTATVLSTYASEARGPSV